MNTETIPRKISRAESELTKLKVLWRDSLSPSDQQYWQQQFASARTQADMRREIRQKYQIDLTDDKQLSRFREWLDDLEAIAAEVRRAEEEHAALLELGLTTAQLRDELLRRMKVRALTRGDFKLALKAISADVKVETLLLGRDKFNVASRAKIDLALDQLATHIKNNPAARAAYESFRDIVKNATL